MFKKKMPLGLLAILAIVGLSAVYFIYQLRGVIFGPRLFIEYPFDGGVLEQGYATIKGKASRTNFLSLNGRKVVVDRDGNFFHSLLLASGYNIIELTLKDNFGREIKIKKEIMVNQDI